MKRTLLAIALASLLFTSSTAFADDDKGDKGDQGPKGDRGDKGDKGDRGPVGDRGPQGPAGANGRDGAQGPVGPQGLQGAPGANGHDGLPGPAGSNGRDGHDGIGGPSGADGRDGAAGPGLTLRTFHEVNLASMTDVGGGSIATMEKDGTIRLSFLGSPSYSLHGKALAFPIMGGFDFYVAIQPDFNIFGATGALVGFRNSGSDVVFGAQHVFTGGTAGWSKGGGEVLYGNTMSVTPPLAVQVGTYPVTALVWFHLWREKAPATTLHLAYSASGLDLSWIQLADSDPSAFFDQFVILGADQAGNLPYSFLVKSFEYSIRSGITE